MDKYNQWNFLKKKIALPNGLVTLFPKEGEVWMTAYGQNIGFEQNGSGGNFSRPVLVVKKFNNHMFWTVPLSTKQKDIDFYYNFIDPQGREVSAILAQLKLTSIKRLKRNMYTLPENNFNKIKDLLRGFF